MSEENKNPALYPIHQEILQKSGITVESTIKYKLRSVTNLEASDLLGFRVDCNGYVILYRGSRFYKIRLDKGRVVEGKETKYLCPRGYEQDLFITILAEENIPNISVPYFIVEGEKKAICLEQANYSTIGVPGVYGWISQGHIVTALTQVNLTGRTVYILFDADKYTNKYVMQAETRLAKALTQLGAKAKIVNFSPEFGKGADDQLIKLGKDDFDYYIQKAKDFNPDVTDEALTLSPEPLNKFLARDIPPVDYWVEGVLMKEGKTMVSATFGSAKSFFVQTLALCVATGQDYFLRDFKVKKGRVLYLDLEMGEPILKERFWKMANSKGLNVEDLFVKYLPFVDLLNSPGEVEGWLAEYKIDVLILDPLSQSWAGDENNAQEVTSLVKQLNLIQMKHKISLVLLHHWRKITKVSAPDAERASGSYKWNAWLTHHILLQGKPNYLFVSSGKSKVSEDFYPFIAKLNKDTLWLEFHKYQMLGKKYTEDTLEETFAKITATTKTNKIPVPDLIEYMPCSETVTRRLIEQSTNYKVDKSEKIHYVYRAEEEGQSNNYSKTPD